MGAADAPPWSVDAPHGWPTPPAVGRHPPTVGRHIPPVVSATPSDVSPATRRNGGLVGGSYRLSEAGTQGIKLNLKLILENQASQLAISIRILLSSYCHFDILREVTKKDYLIPKLLDQA